MNYKLTPGSSVTLINDQKKFGELRQIYIEEGEAYALVRWEPTIRDVQVGLRLLRRAEKNADGEVVPVPLLEDFPLEERARIVREQVARFLDSMLRCSESQLDRQWELMWKESRDAITFPRPRGTAQARETRPCPCCPGTNHKVTFWKCADCRRELPYPSPV